MNNLFEMIEEDFNINVENIQDKMYKIPNIHSKYLRLFFKAKSKLIKLESNHNILYKQKYNYYTNDYENIPENAKETQLLILGDQEIIDSLIGLENQKLLVNTLDRVVNRSQYLANDCKNIIDYIKYLQGI